MVPPFVASLAAVVLLCLSPCICGAQDNPTPTEADRESPDQAVPITISDQPQHVPPATLVFEPLSRKVTIEFTDASIREVVDWIQREASVTVLVDEAALAKVNILPSDPVSDRLSDKPLYLLLERLNTIGLGWYVEDEIIHLTSLAGAAKHMTTRPINVGSFFDQNLESQKLLETIQSTAGDGWEELGTGEGTLVLLGDVLFVRQSDDVHRRVNGLLQGLKKHGRQTFVDDPTAHLATRKKLETQTSVDLKAQPLAEVLDELSQETGVEIRWDVAAFRKNRIREREPISLTLKNQKLTTILGAIVAKLNMTWTLRNGSILITSYDVASELMKTAIYDVRDLCQNDDESYALTDAITTQTDPETWEDAGSGNGVVVFPKSGTMVIRQTERVHAAVLTQLSAYRLALTSSKVRKKVDKSQEKLTVYYKMPTSIASALDQVLKQMIAPTSWKSDQQPDAIGTVARLPSSATLLNPKSPESTPVVENSVLIIVQSRENHELISKLISNIQNGNESFVLGNNGGMGGGGFGGGVFDIPDRREDPKH